MTTRVKQLICTAGMLAAVSNAHAASIEEHVLTNYGLVLEKLSGVGFEGPFAEEVGRMALMRQVIEDGPGRPHTKSMVGMVPGGLNREVMHDLGFKLGEVRFDGLKLSSLTANDGQGCYALYGPRANVVSAAAIALLWDKYVNKLGCFKGSEIRAWNQSRVISRAIARGDAPPQAKVRFRNRLSTPRKQILKKANRIYGGSPETVMRLVDKMEPIFEFVKPSEIHN